MMLPFTWWADFWTPFRSSADWIALTLIPVGYVILTQFVKT
jgi:hypothetical protein